MTEFIQLHVLASYPPSNLNRDDLGRPKTAFMGGTTRLRISSQSLKRAWRTSEVFQEALGGNLGIRTKEMGLRIADAMMTGVSLESVLRHDVDETLRPLIPEKSAMKWAHEIAKVFGAVDGESPKHKQMVHFSPEEIAGIDELIFQCAATSAAPTQSGLSLLRKDHKAADIAMFGRMLADKFGFNVEAAVQVSHAITVHDVVIEDDFFTAVDDLNAGNDEQGAGHLGEFEFAAGLFYTYICINRDLLVENLQGDTELADASIRALVRACATVSPTGKQASFASRAYASYVMAERGTTQPRSLAVSYLSPVKGGGMLPAAITLLEDVKAKMDMAYGLENSSASMNAVTGEGSLREILDFITEAS